MKLGLSLGSVLAMVLTTATAFAGGGDPNYILSGSDHSVSTGDAFTVDIAIDSSAGGDLQGWSFGFCNDPAILSVDGQTLGADSDLANTGGFVNQSLDANGITLGIVINLLGSVVVPPSAAVDVLHVDYTMLGASDTTISFCDTLGTPPVAAVVVVAGQSISPTFVDSQITWIDPNQLVATSATGLLGGTVDTTIDFNNAGGLPEAADAASLSLTYDPAIVSVANVANTVGADFFEVQPGTAAGELVVGLIMDTNAPLDNQIPAAAGTTTLATITWNCDGEGTSAISFVDGLGSPAATNALVLGQSGSYQPGTLVDGSVTVVNYNPFIRGDCNFDNLVNVADGIYLLNFLFQGGAAPTCDDACDTDDDADLAVTDAIAIFNYQFLEGAPPAAPFPAADLDPTQGDGIGCNGDADDL